MNVVIDAMFGEEPVGRWNDLSLLARQFGKTELVQALFLKRLRRGTGR